MTQPAPQDQAPDLQRNVDERGGALRPPRPAAAPKKRANILLNKILTERQASLGDLATALLVEPEIVREYQAGRMMPLEQQMLLAAYAIECVPAQARLGYLLRGQIRAAIAFAARETETHANAPRAGARDPWL